MVSHMQCCLYFGKLFTLMEMYKHPPIGLHCYEFLPRYNYIVAYYPLIKILSSYQTMIGHLLQVVIQESNLYTCR